MRLGREKPQGAEKDLTNRVDVNAKVDKTRQACKIILNGMRRYALESVGGKGRARAGISVPKNFVK